MSRVAWMPVVAQGGAHPDLRIILVDEVRAFVEHGDPARLERAIRAAESRAGR